MSGRSHFRRTMITPRAPEKIDMTKHERTSTPAVSIILPTYNRASFLPQAFEAIWSQTYTEWELIVVDDGSTDDTQAVLNPIASGFSRPVHIIRQANKGAYGA